jgi:hypothetical protein
VSTARAEEKGPDILEVLGKLHMPEDNIFRIIAAD